MRAPKTFAELEVLPGKYAKHLADQAELSRLASAGIPFDVAYFVEARYDIDAIEDLLLDAGMFKVTTGDVVTRLKG